MLSNLPLKCGCGAMRGVAKNVSSEGNRAVCMCDDCQAYAHFLGRADAILDANGGTEIYPVTPAQLELLQGKEQLRCVRLSEHGMFRWYAGCCKTPIGNSQAMTRLPFVGLAHTFFDVPPGKVRDAQLGPIRTRMQARYGIAPLPPGAHLKVPPGFILRVIRFLIPALLKRRQQPSPFFDKHGKPMVAPYVLSHGEREALRKLCGRAPAPNQ